jgi:putative endonuclease
MATIWRDKPSSTGAKVEQHALDWLKRQGLQLVTQNYRCKVGEIDIIMNHAELLVFVEVRFRQQSSFGSALESVDKRKQKKLLRAASHFLACTPKYSNQPCRFDVLALQPGNHSGKLHWLWIKDAFTG